MSTQHEYEQSTSKDKGKGKATGKKEEMKHNSEINQRLYRGPLSRSQNGAEPHCIAVLKGMSGTSPRARGAHTQTQAHVRAGTHVHTSTYADAPIQDTRVWRWCERHPFPAVLHTAL